MKILPSPLREGSGVKNPNDIQKAVGIQKSYNNFGIKSKNLIVF